MLSFNLGNLLKNEGHDGRRSSVAGGKPTPAKIRQHQQVP